MERYGLTRSMSAKGCSPDNAAAEGFFGRMKTESVYPERWEEVVPEFLRTLVFARPRGDDQFADCTFSPSLDMSR